MTTPLIFGAGEQIGPYLLVRHLGSGAFGEVWQAERTAGLDIKVNVALKLQDSRQFPLEQIKREVQVWSWVSDHPHILPLIGVEEYRVRGANYVGIASQYVAGGSVGDWLGRQPGRVADCATACRVLCGILDALEYSHGWRDADTGKPAPIVHRDLKTANVLMNGEMPLIADWGLANIIEGSQDYRFTSHLSGTLSYMSPEALDGRISPRQDIWAAGIMLYKLLSGRVPFDKPERSALIKAIVLNPVPPLPGVVPDAVCEIVARALQKEESQRYPTAAAMRQELVAFLAGYSLADWEKTLPDYEFQQRELEKRLATEEAARRAAEAEMALLRAQIEAQQQAELQRQEAAGQSQAQQQQAAQRRAAEVAEQQQQAAQRRAAALKAQEAQEQEAARLRVAAAERQRQQEAAAAARERDKQSQRFTPAKRLWPKVLAGSAAALLSVSLLGYKLIGGDTVSPPIGAGSTNDVRPTALKSNDYIENLPNGIKLEMVAIPAGKFIMGSPSGEKDRDSDEGPQHEVSVSAMYLGKYEVTQEQWQAVMGNNPSRFQGCAKCPVENVSWNDAKEFIKKLNSLQNKYLYRLPAEAEWEYNVRAGTKTVFAFGDSLSSEQANFDGNYPYGGAAKGKYLQKTTPVGSYQANAFGLYDMHGNVWEWCEDIYNKDYNNLPVNGAANVSVGDSSLRVLRGGSWYSNGSVVRSASRYWIGPSARLGNYGVRLAASAK